MGLCTNLMSMQRICDRKYTNLAIILPGRATLTVQSLPFVGLKTAVGLVVLSSAGLFEDVILGIALASDWRFRFYIASVVFQNAFQIHKSLLSRWFLLCPLY
jgi:hypothetical protein